MWCAHNLHKLSDSSLSKVWTTEIQEGSTTRFLHILAYSGYILKYPNSFMIEEMCS